MREYAGITPAFRQNTIRKKAIVGTNPTPSAISPPRAAGEFPVSPSNKPEAPRKTSAIRALAAGWADDNFIGQMPLLEQH